MGHDATKVLLGGTQSSFRKVTSHVGSIEAGLIVRQKSDGTLSVAKADGEILGVSLGKDLSNAGRTAVCRAGLKVPVQITAAQTPALGAAVNVSDTTGKTAASGAGATAYKGSYSSAVLTGIKEDGTTVDVVLVDMPGGL